MSRRTRPWRGVAYWPLPGGGRLVARRTARASADALAPWLAAAEREGLATDHWEVRPLPEVAALVAQVEHSPAG